ncbi:galactofuranosyltransferase [Macellibacteroides sp. HH-ZS]|jgi:hypothetical protein|nr:galactofuranosyltransferase [Macellibacteroides sp. HH-ZS]
MEKYFFSKNYKETKGAGNKAKTDIEEILLNNGYRNIGIRSDYKGSIIGFFATLLSLIKACVSMKPNNILIIQYPLKKYYTFLCRFAHLRNCEVITIIHDLGSFRRKKLTVELEVALLNQSDYIIAHNDTMKSWLQEQGVKSKLYSLGIFDYLSKSKPQSNENNDHMRLLYAGTLNLRKNPFLKQMGPIVKSYKLNLYGSDYVVPEEYKNRINYKGFVASDKLISTAEGDFGLVWDGDSILSCSGELGEYLKFNNPHKTSLYIRCHLPIIIWSDAALANFVKEHKIGFCIDSLEQIDDLLSGLSKEEYNEIRNNVIKVSDKLSSGYFILTALNSILCQKEN